ncbi:MAG: Adenylosuccinate lyase @ SAICAR lyase, partial [uncultured Solirubrobacteraceae bacterium]
RAGLARLRRGPRPDLEPADDPDRVARLDRRAVPRARPLQPDPHRLRPRPLDVHQPRAGQAAGRGGRGRLVDDAAQGQPDRLREQRGERRGLDRARQPHGRDARDQPAATRPVRLVAHPQRRRRRRPRAARGQERAARPREDRGRRGRHARGARRRVGGPRRGGADRHAQARRRRPVRPAQGADPRGADRRGQASRVRARGRPRRGRPRAPARADPGGVRRARRAARRPRL